MQTPKPKFTYKQHIKTPKSITIVVKDAYRHVKNVTFDSDSDEYAAACLIIKKGKFEELAGLVEKVKKPVPKGVSYSDETQEASFENEKLPPALAGKVKQFIDAELDITPLREFWKRCKKNPSQYSRDDLFRYIEKYDICILPDGRFVVYKGVNSNLTSKHDSTTQHVVGKHLTVDRSRCASTPNNACGYGLHSAPWGYVTNYYSSGEYLEIILDPEDVTSVPANESKIRCWRYFVNRIVSKDGIGIKTGLVGSAKHVKTVAPEDNEVNLAQIRKVKGKEFKKKTPAKKAAVISKKEKNKAPKYVQVPLLDSVTIPGAVLIAAGFSPGQKVKLWLGKNRALILPVDVPSKSKRDEFIINEEALIRRYKLSDDSGTESTIKTSGSLRIRANILKHHLGLEDDDSFKVGVLEQNAVAIYKN